MKLRNLQTPFQIVIAVLLTADAAYGQSQGFSEFDEALFSARVEEMRASTAVPGVAVAVMQDGEVLLVKGFGVAGPDGRPVTGQTSFQIGSVTKSFVALVILQLAAEGKLGLDDPVVRYIPTFRTIDKAASDRITIDHLVTHFSGLTTLAGNRNRGPTGQGSDGPANAVADLASEALSAEPGRSYQYSNANYAILSYLIEVLDGQSFEQALSRRIFEPLGMKNSFVRRPTSGQTDVASGCRSWFEVARPTDIVGGRRMMGAGGVTASAEDMARYMIAVQTRDPRVVPSSSDRLFEPKPIYGSFGYAYGWVIDQGPDGDLISHTGLTPGFSTMAAISTATGRSVVVLTNLSGILQGELALAVVHEALELESIKAAPTLSARLGLWSLVVAMLGIATWLFKTARRLFEKRVPMRAWVRWLNVGAVLGLGGAVAAAWVLFPQVVGLPILSAHVYFPDLALMMLTSCGLAIALALGRLVLVIRGG